MISSPLKLNPVKFSKFNSINRVIKKLKFQNIIYQAGDNIRVRSEVNSQKDLFAKILIIIQAKNITPFPLIYVIWY